MEHLPNGGHGPSFKVPFFGQLYEGDDFLAYPQALGWDTEWLTSWTWDKKGKSLQELHAFLQAWLFFGLIKHTTGMSIPCSDFIYTHQDGKEYITTAPLLDYAEKWKLRDYAAIKDSGKQDILRKTTPYLQRANSVVLQLWQRFAVRQPAEVSHQASGLSSELLLSLQLIGAALTRARTHVYYDSSWHIKEKASFYYHWGNSKLMQSHMLKLGWCKSIAAAFMSKKLDVQCFAASLEPLKVKKDHTQCSERTCLGNQVSETGYEVKHTTRDCQCQFVGPNIDSLVSILREYQRPLILLPTRVDDLGEKGSLEVVAFQPGMHYLAFSHVWKDGLGNPLQNTLPMCQILRLAGLVRVVHTARKNTEGGMSSNTVAGNPTDPNERILVWIDTFCIPVESKYKKVRNLAIGSMRHVYQEADTMLVMDDDLRQIPLENTSFRRTPIDRMMLLFRFLLCGWSSRLWTFEEGMLAKDVYFLLRDGVIRAKDLYYRSSIDLHMLQDIASESVSLLHETVYGQSYTKGDQELTLGHIIRGLKNRQTSRSIDETICISHMLATDTDRLLQAKPESRMQTFLDSLQKMPPGLLFMGEPRLTDKGYRWAPTSFLHRQEKCYESQRLLILPRHPWPGRPPAEMTSDGSGLKFSSSGVCLGLFDDLPQEPEFDLHFPPDSRTPLTANYDRDPALEYVSWEGVRANHQKRAAALLLPSHIAEYSDPVDCVLVALLEEESEDDFIHCNVVCSFQIRDTRPGTTSIEASQDLQLSARATWLRHTQTWIVD